MVDRAHHPRARRLQRPQDDRQRFLDNRRKAVESSLATASTGRPARRWLSRRCSTRASPCACRARTASAARFAAPFGADRSGDRGALSAVQQSPGRQGRYEVINSMLSEEAVLGFEYGYSLAEPNALTIWEAQFGDFAERRHRWCSTSSCPPASASGCACRARLHAAARLRGPGAGTFVGAAGALPANVRGRQHAGRRTCTTPANFFHIAAPPAQALDFRKPLITMTPKSMLRNKRAVSALTGLRPRLVVPPAAVGPRRDGHKGEKAQARGGQRKIRRVVILCSGKVYYDLYDDREKRGIDDVYLLRIEQLVSVPAQGAGQRADALQTRRGRLVPGGAEEHGALELSSSPTSNGCSARSAASRSVARYVGTPGHRRRRRPGLMSKHLAQLKAFRRRMLWRVKRDALFPEQTDARLAKPFARLRARRSAAVTLAHQDFWLPFQVNARPRDWSWARSTAKALMA